MSSFARLSIVPTEPTTPSRPCVKIVKRKGLQYPNTNHVETRPRIAVLEKPSTTPVTPVPTVRRLRPVLLSQGNTRKSVRPSEASEIETAAVLDTHTQIGVASETPVTPSEIRRSVRKKLFLEDRHSKRLCQNRKPTISIRGHTQRTQPAFPRASVPYLVSRYDELIQTALSSCSAFRTFVTSPEAHVDRACFKDSLLVNVKHRIGNNFLVRQLTNGSEERGPTIAVFALASMIHDDRSNTTQVHTASLDGNNLALFIPQPWYTSNPDWLQSSQVDALITPFRVCLVERHRIPTEASNIIPSTSLFAFQSRRERKRLEESDDSAQILLRFTDLSPHHIRINIRVRTIFLIEDAFLAVVVDVMDDLALYKYSQGNSPPIGELTLQNVNVAPCGLYRQTILNLITANYEHPDPLVLGQLKKVGEKLLVLTQMPD